MRERRRVGKSDDYMSNKEQLKYLKEIAQNGKTGDMLSILNLTYFIFLTLVIIFLTNYSDKIPLEVALISYGIALIAGVVILLILMRQVFGFKKLGDRIKKWRKKSQSNIQSWEGDRKTDECDRWF